MAFSVHVLACAVKSDFARGFDYAALPGEPLGDGGHCDARLDRDQVDADQRDPGRRVDDDALVEHPVKHLNLSCGATHALDGH